MDSKLQILNYFITQVVDGWMLTDLERLTNIPHRSGAAGNCNFPIALYTFACIEFLGQLTHDTPIDPHQSDHTKISILGFIDDFFPDDFKRELQPHKDRFVNIFRNGLAHSYFAKAAGISRTKPKPFSVENGYLVLDADRFADAFKSAVDNLKKAIKTNPQLVERMVDRYDKQYKDNLKLKLSPTLAYTSTATARSSGASLPHPDMLKRIETFTTTSPIVDLSKTTTTLPPWLNPKDES